MMVLKKIGFLCVWLIVAGATLGVLLGFGGGFSPVLDAIGFFRIHFAVLAITGSALAFMLDRHRAMWIGFAAAAVAALSLGPVWRSVERSSVEFAETRSVTVMTANIFGRNNPSLHLTASVLMAVDADILAVIEAPPDWSEQGAVLAHHYPFSTVQAKARNGTILFSKFPLERVETAFASPDTPAFATAFAKIGQGVGLGISAVHLSWPVVVRDAQRKQVTILGSLLPAGARSTVLMGDFNAAPWSTAMRQVEMRTGLSMIGGFRRTWRGGYPNLLHFAATGSLYGNEIPSLLGHHIDHVLVSPDIGIDAIETFPLPGSDHHAVWSRINVPVRPTGPLLAGG